MYDNRLAGQVIGALFKSPEILSDTDAYILTTDDFDNRLHRISFSIIYNLYHSGMVKIDLAAVLTYLKDYPELNLFFEENKGVDFLLNASEIAELKNFDFYYKKLKKISLLRNLKQSGYDTSPFYNEGLVELSIRQKVEERFERAEIHDIIAYYSGNLHEIEAKFTNKRNFSLEAAHESIRDLKESLKVAPEMGYNLNSALLTTAARGARRSKYYLLSGGTGTGKSRIAMGQACRMAYPFYYDIQKERWILTGATQRVLFISTELDHSEVKTVLLAYLSGVNEDVILNGNYTPEQEKRVDQAIALMEYYKDNFYIYHLPDPNINQLNTNVRRLVIQHKIDALFFDYIHTSAQLITEFMGARVREDVVLLMMSTALKNLANEMQIFCWSSTQLNGNTEDLEFAGPHSLRGSRAIADKADFGAVIRHATPEVLSSIKHILTNGASFRKPNAYIDVYKNRRSKFVMVRIWVQLDLGTGRIEDCFMTDGYGNLMDVTIVQPKISLDITPEDIFGKIETKEKKQEKPKKISITL